MAQWRRTVIAPLRRVTLRHLYKVEQTTKLNGYFHLTKGECNMILQEQIQKKRGNPNWKKGESGNPTGRPLGSRNKIAENVLTGFSLTTGEDAETSLRELRANDPGKFWQIAANLLPKEVAVSIQQAVPAGLAAQSWPTLSRVLDLIERFAPDSAEKVDIFQTIERALIQAYVEPPEPLAIEHRPALLPSPPYQKTDCVSVSPINF